MELPRREKLFFAPAQSRCSSAASSRQHKRIASLLQLDYDVVVRDVGSTLMDIPLDVDEYVAATMTADVDGFLPHISYWGAFSTRLTPR